MISESTITIFGETAVSRNRITVEIIEFIPNTGKSKTFIKTTTGSRIVLSTITADLFDNKSNSDCYIQVLTGNPELTVHSKTNILKPGDGILIPANTVFSFNHSLNFKIVFTVINEEFE